MKEHSADTVVVVGGVHPTVRPAEMLGCEEVDIAVRGEGLITQVEIAEAVAGGGEFSEIKGISYRRDGEIVHNPARPLEPNVDRFPFPAGDFQLSTFNFSDHQPPAGIGRFEVEAEKNHAEAAGVVAGARLRRDEGVADDLESTTPPSDVRRRDVDGDRRAGLTDLQWIATSPAR